jgi:hypothetical protein
MIVARLWRYGALDTAYLCDAADLTSVDLRFSILPSVRKAGAAPVH